MKAIKQLRRKIYIIVTLIIRLMTTAFAGTIAAALFVDIAAKERGYYAVGGEWIVIVGLTVVAWWLTGLLTKELLKGWHKMF